MTENKFQDKRENWIYFIIGGIIFFIIYAINLLEVISDLIYFLDTETGTSSHFVLIEIYTLTFCLIGIGFIIHGIKLKKIPISAQ